jgi:Fe2+ or Zn2+ uptake regulation protein
MNAYTQLKKHNIKPSIQRIEIMNYLLTHRTHPSVDEVYTSLSKNMPTLSKTTVYNTLRLLSEQGAALMLTIDETRLCFDGDTSPHTHFFCKKCGRIFDLPLTESLAKQIGKIDEGHMITDVHYYYRGICKDCLTD